MSKFNQLVEQAANHGVTLTSEESNYLVEKGYDKLSNPLQSAISKKDEVAVSLLFRISEDKDADALLGFLASQAFLKLNKANDHEQLMDQKYEQMIKQKYEQYKEPLYRAIINEDIEAVKVLSGMYDVNKIVNDLNLLHHAFSVTGRPEDTGIYSTAASLSERAWPSEQVKYNEEIVLILGKAGANFSYCNSIATQPILHKYIHHPKIVNFLLEKKLVDPNAKDYYGFTPLYYCKNSTTLEMLIKAGVDINQKCDEHGNTVLHIACLEYNKCVRLLKFGASVHIKNFKEETPLAKLLAEMLSYAENKLIDGSDSSDYPKLLKILIKAGSEITTDLKNQAWRIDQLFKEAKLPLSLYNVLNNVQNDNPITDKFLSDTPTPIDYNKSIEIKKYLARNPAIKTLIDLTIKQNNSLDIVEYKESDDVSHLGEGFENM